LTGGEFSVLGTVNIIPTPDERRLEAYTARVYANNGFADVKRDDEDHDHGGPRRDSNDPIPNEPGKASPQIKHVIFINKENATHDLMLGDITTTRSGMPVDGEPRFALGPDARPNHHELALRLRRTTRRTAPTTWTAIARSFWRLARG
jgi:hypothetical protein